MSVKDKLAQFGRPVTDITLQFGGIQELTVKYQCLTARNERVVREVMREEYQNQLDAFKTSVKEGVPSAYDKWLEEFTAVGDEKMARFIVASDSQSIRNDTIREMGREPLAPGATEEEEKAWKDDFIPIFERLVEENVAAVKSSSTEELAQSCVKIQCEAEAQKRAYDVYRLRLIQESILEPITDKDGNELVPAQYKRVFDNVTEVEELLAPSTVDELSTRIAEEVRRDHSIPLKSA